MSYLQRLRARRRELEISQEQLALRMADHGYQWSRHIVMRIETGKRPLAVSELLALADILDITPEAVLNG